MKKGYIRGYDTTNGIWRPVKVDPSGNLVTSAANILDETPTNGESLKGITSGWAYTHVNTADAHHTKYTDADARSAVQTWDWPDGSKEYYQIADKYLGAGSVDGALKITLPVSWTNTWLGLELIISSFQNERLHSRVWLSGRMDVSNTEWDYGAGNIMGQLPDERLRFGHDGTHCCIVIGQIGTTWSYPYIWLKRVLARWSVVTGYDSGWNFSLETDLSGITFTGDTRLNAGLFTDTPDPSESGRGVSAVWAYNHIADASAHHSRYTDSEAITAVQGKPILHFAGQLNLDLGNDPLVFTGASEGNYKVDVDTAGFWLQTPNNPTGAVIRVGPPGGTDRYKQFVINRVLDIHFSFDNALTLVGPTVDLTGDITMDAGKTVDGVDVSAHAADASAHHTRYTDAEAVSAMGSKADNNPLNHDRLTLSDVYTAYFTRFITAGECFFTVEDFGIHNPLTMRLHDAVTEHMRGSLYAPAGCTGIASAHLLINSTTSADLYLQLFMHSIDSQTEGEMPESNYASPSAQATGGTNLRRIAFPSAVYSGLTVAGKQLIGFTVSRYGGNASDTYDADLDVYGVEIVFN